MQSISLCCQRWRPDEGSGLPSLGEMTACVAVQEMKPQAKSGMGHEAPFIQGQWLHGGWGWCNGTPLQYCLENPMDRGAW